MGSFGFFPLLKNKFSFCKTARVNHREEIGGPQKQKTSENGSHMCVFPNNVEK